MNPKMKLAFQYLLFSVVFVMFCASATVYVIGTEHMVAPSQSRAIRLAAASPSLSIALSATANPDGTQTLVIPAQTLTLPAYTQPAPPTTVTWTVPADLSACAWLQGGNLTGQPTAINERVSIFARHDITNVDPGSLRFGDWKGHTLDFMQYDPTSRPPNSVTWPTTRVTVTCTDSVCLTGVDLALVVHPALPANIHPAPLCAAPLATTQPITFVHGDNAISNGYFSSLNGAIMAIGPGSSTNYSGAIGGDSGRGFMSGRNGQTVTRGVVTTATAGPAITVQANQTLIIAAYHELQKRDPSIPNLVILDSALTP